MKHQNQNETELSWEAPEFPERTRSTNWYIMFAIISVILIGFAVWVGSVITIIMFCLLIAVGFGFAVQKPKQVDYSINSQGIVVGKLIYPYKNIRKFWIIYDPPAVKTLNFETTAYLNNVISIELGNQDPLPVKSKLKNHLFEDLDREESFADILARKAKF
ncbi:MAG TPA: hypothetical protein VGQ87_03395 [Patescibacteria group bacterium]|jgi:hypothetical protein|nr:hypothetical protein [Patescibacteria group bacterium]